MLGRRLDEQPVSLVGTPSREAGGDVAALLSDNPLIVPTPETALRAGFDALIDRMGIVPRIAAEADDMAMLRLLARDDVGLAVIPPIVVKGELETGMLAELAQLDGISEVFFAVTMRRRFPNPLIKDVLP